MLLEKMKLDVIDEVRFTHVTFLTNRVFCVNTFRWRWPVMMTTTNKSSRVINHICRQEDHDQKALLKR